MRAAILVCAVPLFFGGSHWQQAAIGTVLLPPVSPEYAQQKPLDYMAMLKSPKADVRQFGARALGNEKNVAAIPALTALLKDKDAGVREAVAEALGKLGPKAAPPLTDALGFSTDETKLAVLRGLRQLGTDAKAALVPVSAALKDKNTDIRIHAAATLGAMKAEAKSAVPELIEAAKDTASAKREANSDLPNRVVDAAVAAALEIDPNCAADLAKAALPGLLPDLESKNERIVQTAAETIARLGEQGKPALPGLEAAYKNSTGLLETTLSQAILAVGGDAATTLAGIISDAKLPLAKRLMALSDLSAVPNPDDRVATVLIAALKDKEPQIRAAAAMAATIIGPPAKSAIPALIELLGDETLDEAADKVQSGASKVVPLALARIGPDAVGALAAVLKDESKKSFARWQAAGALSNMGRRAKGVLAALETCLKDKSPLVAVETACAYLRAGGDPAKAVPVLTQGLQDKQASIARHAADAVRRLGPKAKETVPLLTTLLKDKERESRIAAVQALSAMGAHAKPAVPALAQLLQQKDDDQRLQIIVALQQLGPYAKAALPALIERLKDMKPISHHPLLAVIGEFGPDAKAAVPALVELLRSKDVIFHNDTMIALGLIGPTAQPAVSRLQSFLDNASEYPRAHAARALGGIGPKAAAAGPALKRMLLKEEKKLVRVWAYYALARITGDNRSNVTALNEIWDANPDDENQLTDSVRYAVAQVLDLLGTEAKPAQQMILTNVLDEKTPPGTRLLLAKALGQFRSDASSIVPKMVELIDRKSDGFARVANIECAARCLGEMGPAANKAIPSLQNLTNDEDDDIAAAAGWALEKIQGKSL